MKQTFEQNKYKVVYQNGTRLVVCGYTDSHIIGATNDKNDRTWTTLDKGSYVIPTYQGGNYIYINSELLN